MNRLRALGGGRYGHVGYEGLGEEAVKKLWATLRPIQPEELARRALDAVLRDEAIIVVPGWWRALWMLDRLAPTGVLRVYELVLAKTRKDLAAVGAVRANRASRRGTPSGDVPGKARRPMTN